MSSEVFDRRFSGIANLYGAQALMRFGRAHVCVIGVGGVGSWVVESLARSGIGELTLVDMDVVAESNINRQLVASSDTLGMDKIRAMGARVHSINPDCEVHLVDEFISLTNLHEIVASEFDYVVDCIDDFRIKAGLIAYCKKHKIKVLTVGGAGGQVNPSLIRQSDLSRTQHDALLARTRKLLRQDYGFARNPKRSFGVACVYSDEQARFADGQGGVTFERPVQREGGSELDGFMPLSCAGGLGSVTHVTASFGFFAVATVLSFLADVS